MDSASSFALSVVLSRRPETSRSLESNLAGHGRRHKLLAKDKDYILDAEAGIKIVDAFSGRVLEGRRWTDGLQQSVEVKEGLPPSSQTRPSATVTFQALFRGIATKLAGMTGTARSASVKGRPGSEAKGATFWLLEKV